MDILCGGLGLTLIAALTTFTVIIILTNILIRNTEYSKNGISISSDYNLQKIRIPVEKIALIYSNSGFIGLPLINGVIGQEGVFYMTAYLTVFNLLLWTHGVIVMGGAGDLKIYMQESLHTNHYSHIRWCYMLRYWHKNTCCYR